MNFREYRYWSMTDGGEVLRLSATCSDGQERFVMLDVNQPGREYRKQREIARRALESAVRRGLPPGRLHLSYEETE